MAYLEHDIAPLSVHVCVVVDDVARRKARTDDHAAEEECLEEGDALLDHLPGLLRLGPREEVVEVHAHAVSIALEQQQGGEAHHTRAAHEHAEHDLHAVAVGQHCRDECDEVGKQPHGGAQQDQHQVHHGLLIAALLVPLPQIGVAELDAEEGVASPPVVGPRAQVDGLC